jgi:hypothetical protein
MSMSDEGPEVSEEEMAAFHNVADVFLNTANAAMGEEPPDRIGAAFIYATSRFSAFAMQAQLDEGETVDAETREFLAARFDHELREHALQHLRSAGASAPGVPGVPDAAIDVLVSLNDMAEEPRRLFLRLADRFIHPANDLIGEEGIARTASAMMHACTRFNAYVMQARGLAPGVLDDAIAGDFQSTFRTLLEFHLGASVIADRPG